MHLQTAFYFGYMSVVCYAFLLMLGTVGFRASLTFVRQATGCCLAVLLECPPSWPVASHTDVIVPHRHIYRAIKCE